MTQKISPQALEDLFRTVTLRYEGEWVSIAHSLGRVVCQDHYSEHQEPAYPKTLMAGYALVGDNHKTWRLVSCVDALQEGCALYLEENAPVPEKMTLFARKEALRVSDQQVSFKVELNPSKHIASIGSRIAKGTQLLHTGQHISSLDIYHCQLAGLMRAYCEKVLSLTLVVLGETSSLENQATLSLLKTTLTSDVQLKTEHFLEYATLTHHFERLQQDTDILLLVSPQLHDLSALGFTHYQLKQTPLSELSVFQVESKICVHLALHPLSLLTFLSVYLNPVIARHYRRLTQEHKVTSLQAYQPKSKDLYFLARIEDKEQQTVSFHTGKDTRQLFSAQPYQGLVKITANQAIEIGDSLIFYPFTLVLK